MANHKPNVVNNAEESSFGGGFFYIVRKEVYVYLKLL